MGVGLDPHLEYQRRAHARLRLGIVARLETLHGRRVARLVDLSRSGAQLILNDERPLQRAVVSWLGYEAFGFTAWQQGDHVGIEFDDMIPMAWLMTTRERAPAVVQNEALGDPAAARAFVEGRLSLGD